MSGSASADGAGSSIAALIVAAGRGTRMGAGPPKQYRDLGGRAVIARTIAAFLALPEVTRVVAVIHPDDGEAYQAAIAGIEDGRLAAPATGGPSRQASVANGLEALEAAGPPALVLIHDAARPLVTGETIRAVIAALAAHPASLPVVSVADTLKRGSGGRVTATVPRDGLFRAQTPQGFRFPAILEAHRAAAAGEDAATDDAFLAEQAGLAIAMVEGDPDNFKITTEDDLKAAHRMLTRTMDPLTPVSCTGFGYDVHMLVPGDGVILGGVTIPHSHRLDGHSDADVALHALTDALFGAIADGDIGAHFPPSDPKWKGASSDRFLAYAARRVAERGGTIVHLDLTVVCEKPKIGPHRDAIRARIAEIVGIAVERVSVKATTTERLGFTGREEGIAACAVASVVMPAGNCTGPA